MNADQKIYAFIDAIQTVTARDSFYNSKDAKVEALKKLHQDIKAIDSDLYKLFIFYPGINDYNKLNIMGNVLSDKELTNVNLPVAGLKPTHEAYESVLRDMGYPRVMRFFIECKERKINNKRLKKTILSYVLGDDGIANRSLQYKKKMKQVLEHAWGKKQTSAIVAALVTMREGSADSKALSFLGKEVFRFANSDIQKSELAEVLCFVFGVKTTFRNPLYVAYENAKTNIELALDKLPRRTLIGLRNNHHKDFDMGLLYQKSEDKQTEKDKVSSVRAASKVGVDQKLTSNTLSTRKLDELYKYAYEMGLSEEVKQAITASAHKVAEKMEFGFNNVAVIVDNSPSMGGKAGSKNDPIAKALSFAKFLEISTPVVKKYFTSDVLNDELPELSGDSCYAKSLIQAVKGNPDAIFVIGDGYENAPEGLTALTIKGLRNCGYNQKIIHINPVYAVEAARSKTISPDVVTLPFNDINRLEGSFMKILLQKNPNKGVQFMKTMLFGYAYKYYGVQLSADLRKELSMMKKIDIGALL